MYQTPNFDFYIGSDNITQTASLARSAISKPSKETNSSYTGAGFFLGFALKIGPVIEHPMNASTIPTPKPCNAI